MKPTLPLLLIAAGAVSAAEALPEPAAIEMKRLQETYRVLDFTAEKVWPGWKNYRDVPFLFEFENGLRLLVRHPQPPSPFQPVEGLKVESRQVFADRSAVTAKPLVAPLLAGGGPIPFGTGADGKPVQVVRINLRSATGSPNDDDAPARIRSEEQISVYLHELFHCFQRTLGLQVFGNLRINADTRFAAYSEVEGLALGRAYAEKDPAKASEYLADFLAARRARRTAMNLMQQYQESSDEFNEGTATYAQVRTYEILRSGATRPG
jgi:hypothetical protein